MTGDEYRRLRDELRFTQAQLANALDIDQSTVARRENSASPIDTEAEIAIRSLRQTAEAEPTGAG